MPLSQLSATACSDPAGTVLEIARLHGLLFAARALVDGLHPGRHPSRRHDVGSEFAEHRPYAPGDDLRAVDWKAAARSDRLSVRLFRTDTELTAHLVVDGSASMAYAGRGGASKYEYCSLLAVAMSLLLVRQGDRPGLVIAGQEPARALAPERTWRQVHAVSEELSKWRPRSSGTIASALRGCFPTAQRRGLIVVLSDLLEEPAPLLDSLVWLRARGFRAVLLQVLTDEERRLEVGGPARFVDPETDAAVEADPAAIRGAYQIALQAHLDRIARLARQIRAPYTLATTWTSPLHVLSRYLASSGPA